MIYFIESQGLVKIGFSVKPELRLVKIKADSPHNCSLIGVMNGDTNDEAAIHAMFDHLRHRGEWFKLSPELMDFISKNAVEAKKKSKRTIAPTDNPISAYVHRTGRNVTDLANRAGCSRMTLYRLMRGKQNATIDLLVRVSAATDGEVSVGDLILEAAQ